MEIGQRTAIKRHYLLPTLDNADRFDHHLELANKSCMASKADTNEVESWQANGVPRHNLIRWHVRHNDL